MGLMSRRKGQQGERDLAALIREHTGWDAERRVRQHDGDSDILGVPGWSIEVKRQAKAPRGSISRWWAQAVEQAEGNLPVLFFRADRDEWRAVWPLAIQLVEQQASYWREYKWTSESSIEAWACVARELTGGPRGH